MLLPSDTADRPYQAETGRYGFFRDDTDYVVKEADNQFRADIYTW